MSITRSTNNTVELIVHHKISDLYKFLNLPIEQEIDFTVHFKPDLVTELPFKSPIFRAEYFSFVFVKKGSGFYTIDAHRFPYESQTIYFTNPGHIKSYEVNEMEDAYMITFTDSFLRENVHHDIFDEFPFLLAEIVPPKKLTDEEYADFEVLYKQLWDELKKDSTYKNRILGSLFVVLLLKIKELFWSSYNPRIEGDRDSQIVKSFKQLLEKEFGKMVSESGANRRPQVKDFADKLHLHPNYLNSVIRSKTGKTIIDWLTDRTLTTARSLLTNTALSSKEIAYKLGFSEPTHFNRFFKKHQHTTPNAYRKSLHSLK